MNRCNALGPIAISLLASLFLTGCPPPDCNDGNDCTIDSWNGSACVHDPAPAGTTCNDNSLCTTDDKCTATGTCTGTAANCDDSNNCTIDSCVPATGCAHTNADTTVACSDGNQCTAGDHCNGLGSCSSGAPINCDDSVACTVDQCSPATGCSHTPNHSLCNDSNLCTEDGCNVLSGCYHNPLADTEPCDDGDVCTEGDHCDGLGTCASGTPATCNDANDCTTDHCDPGTGCAHDNLPATTDCSDGSACTVGDKCNGTGVCVPGTVVNCDDGQVCTQDECEPSTGNCLHTGAPITTACDDLSVCTLSDHCDGLGSCIGTPDTGAPCNDGTVCTTGDACSAQGVCVGTPVALDDGVACTQDNCDPISGVTHTPAAAGTPCPDGIASNGDELCDGALGCLAGMNAVPVLERVGGQDPNVKERRLGAGRHPVAAGESGMAVAFLELLLNDTSPPRLGVATFSLVGQGRGVGRILSVPMEADPVVAPLPDGSFALAYSSLEVDGDGLGVALVRVSSTGTILGTASVANETTLFSQRSPDILWTGTELVVAWEDESPSDGRRICTRPFSAQLAPLESESCEGGQSTWGSRVSLATAGGETAIAWRNDGLTLSTLEVRFGAASASLVIDQPPPAEPAALVALDSTHVLAVYTDGCGVQKAVVVGSSGVDYSSVLNATAERYQPSLVKTIDGLYVSWRELQAGVNYDDVMIQKLVWDGTNLTAEAPVPIPADAAHLIGDQNLAALASVGNPPKGAILGAWEDLNANVVGQSPHGDVLVSLVVTPIGN